MGIYSLLSFCLVFTRVQALQVPEGQVQPWQEGKSHCCFSYSRSGERKLLANFSFTPALFFLGDCGPPPDIPNARPILGRHSKFAEQSKVAYSCNNGFKQVPDKSNIVVCLENGQWSSHETFCESKFFISLSEKFWECGSR